MEAGITEDLITEIRKSGVSFLIYVNAKFSAGGY